MAINFKIDKEGELRWDQDVRGGSLTQEEARTIAISEIASMRGWLSRSVQAVAEAIVESKPTDD